MSVSYFIPDLAPEDLHRCEEIVRRSRFIVSLAHTPTPEAAKSFIERIKQEFPDATHNCWAYAAGAPGQTSKVGYSDDGEPHGTAGLVRAYQGMVKLGLETLPTREHMIPARVEVVLDYPHITVFRRLLPDYRATVASENFGVDATYELLLPDQNIPALETALTELTDGAVLITRLDDGTMPPETP